MRVALARQLGGTDRVQLAELPAPVPAAGQALVRVYGAGVGPWDAGFLSGGFPGLALPFVPGQEIAGAVEVAGDGAGVQPGGRVYASLFPAGGGCRRTGAGVGGPAGRRRRLRPAGWATASPQLGRRSAELRPEP